METSSIMRTLTLIALACNLLSLGQQTHAACTAKEHVDVEGQQDCAASYAPRQGPDVPDGKCAFLSAHEISVYALLALYNSAGGTRWYNSRGWGDCESEEGICSWYGVECEAGAVIAVKLSDNNLQGVVPEAFFKNLPLLERVDLSFNKLRGALPKALWGGTQRINSLLTTLQISHNSLSGSIPNLSGLRYLTTLNLAVNRLSGALPKFPPSLFLIDLSTNMLSGQLRPDILRLPVLQTCDFSNNNLQGPLPDIPLTSKLSYLRISNNLLSGLVPPSWGSAEFLNRIDISGNALYGELSPSLYSLWRLPSNDLLTVEKNTTITSVVCGFHLDLSQTCVSGDVSSLLWSSQGGEVEGGGCFLGGTLDLRDTRTAECVALQ